MNLKNVLDSGEMNTDKLSLFTVAAGPRGSDKTLYQTSVACERIIKSHYASIYPDKVPPWLGGPVYSNYPIGFWFEIEGHEPVYLEALPLNMEALITFDNDLIHSWVFIDEIDIWADRQEWQSATAKLLAKVFQQIRKKKMSLMGTIQDLSWLNRRLAFQADIVIKCREAAFTPWGRANHLDIGQVGFLNFRDKSGVLTGYTFEETGREHRRIFQGKRFWNCYDTEYEFDVLANSIRYSIKRPEREIDVTGKDIVVTEVESSSLRSERKERDFVAIADLVNELKSSGYMELKKSEFFKIAEQRGYDFDHREAGKHLAKLGTETCGYAKGKYNFEKVV